MLVSSPVNARSIVTTVVVSVSPMDVHVTLVGGAVPVPTRCVTNVIRTAAAALLLVYAFVIAVGRGHNVPGKRGFQNFRSGSSWAE